MNDNKQSFRLEFDILPDPFSRQGINPVLGSMWSHFGDPQLFLQPLGASLGALLARPIVREGEIVNDRRGFVANFLRAVKHDPEAVAAHVAYTVKEVELTAHYQWLIKNGRESLAPLLAGDPDWFDARIAGWWAGDSPLWLSAETRTVAQALRSQKEKTIDQPVKTVQARIACVAASLAGPGASAWLLDLTARLKQLSARLSGVTILCGDWRRAVSPALLTRETAVLLAPQDGSGSKTLPSAQGDVPAECRQWALEHGKRLRIALCGRASDEEMPGDWQVYDPKLAAGSSGSPERIWFSPGCKSLQLMLF